MNLNLLCLFLADSLYLFVSNLLFVLLARVMTYFKRVQKKYKIGWQNCTLLNL
jgi:hypothetical protein